MSIADLLTMSTAHLLKYETVVSLKFQINQEHFAYLHSEHNKAITDKWIESLKSGRHIQTQGAMFDPHTPNSACCLFVLEKECNNKTENDFTVGIAHDTPSGKKGVPASAPDYIDDYLVLKTVSSYEIPFQDIEASVVGITDKRTELFHLQVIPALWNDFYDLSFDEIATLLKEGELTITKESTIRHFIARQPSKGAGQ